jgi:hypothetical protein
MGQFFPCTMISDEPLMERQSQFLMHEECSCAGLPASWMQVDRFVKPKYMDKNLSLVSYLRASTTTARPTVFDFQNLNVMANFPLICSGAVLTGRLTPPVSTMISCDLDCPRRDVIKWNGSLLPLLLAVVRTRGLTVGCGYAPRQQQQQQ